MRVATHRAPHFVFVEHEFEVPLDHESRRGEKITVFAREVIKVGREDDDLPWLVFLGRPTYRSAPAWAPGTWLCGRTEPCHRVSVG